MSTQHMCARSSLEANGSQVLARRGWQNTIKTKVTTTPRTMMQKWLLCIFDEENKKKICRDMMIDFTIKFATGAKSVHKLDWHDTCFGIV